MKTAVESGELAVTETPFERLNSQLPTPPLLTK
jgi:hypothetical protein